MPFTTKSIANFFIDRATSSGEKLTPMKLQKLVYYAMGWYAGYTRKPLVDEAVEAWQYGPVFPSLYQEFKRFGAGAITSKATELDDNLDEVDIAPPNDPNIRKFLENIWESYGRFSAVELSEMTHAVNSPWDVAWKSAQGVRNKDIAFELIHKHFAQAVETTQAGS